MLWAILGPHGKDPLRNPMEHPQNCPTKAWGGWGIYLLLRGAQPETIPYSLVSACGRLSKLRVFLQDLRCMDICTHRLSSFFNQ